MASISQIPSYNNLSRCVYIGNTTSINNDILFNYCSQFGSISSSSFGREKFCDFHIFEFTHYEQLTNFLQISNHCINNRILEVKLYKNILINNDILHLDRKFYIGPILNSNDIHLIVQFYQKFDPILQYYLLKQDEEEYLLLQFSNRQSISTIFPKHANFITIQHRKFFLYKPFHPKQLVRKIISMKNKTNQIYIDGLTDKITNEMLINHFHKRTPVIACHILSNNPTCAVIEFNDETTIRKILDVPEVRVQGIILRLSQASRHVASLLFPSNDNAETHDNHTKQSTQNSSPVTISRMITTDTVCISSPVHSEAGWSSPPRTIIDHCLPIEPPSNQCSPKLSMIDTSMKTDTTSDVDIKPIAKIPTNNLLRFYEQYQVELEQIKDDYMLKFAKDRTYIEREIDVLINEERRTFENLKQYLNDNKKRAEKRHNQKRKSYSSSSHD